jgi:hypothetical protein
LGSGYGNCSVIIDSLLAEPGDSRLGAIELGVRR